MNLSLRIPFLIVLMFAAPGSASRCLAGAKAFRNKCALGISAAIGVWLAMPSPTGREASDSLSVVRPSWPPPSVGSAGGLSGSSSKSFLRTGGGNASQAVPLDVATQLFLDELYAHARRGEPWSVELEESIGNLTVLTDSWGSWAAAAIKCALEERNPELSNLSGWKENGVPVPVEKVLVQPAPKIGIHDPQRVLLGVSGAYWTAWSTESFEVTALFREEPFRAVFRFTEKTPKGSVEVVVQGWVHPLGHGRLEFQQAQGRLRATSSMGVWAEDDFSLPQLRADFSN